MDGAVQAEEEMCAEDPADSAVVLTFHVHYQQGDEALSDTVEDAPLAGPAQLSAEVRRSRWLLTGYFVIQGVAMATWATRLPAVQEAAGLTPGALSLALLAASTAMISMLLVSGRLAERPHGTGRLLLGAALALGTALVLVGQVRSFGPMVAVAALFGTGQGMLLVPLNTAGAALSRECERQCGRPIMASLHAAYSVSAVCTAGAATVTAQLSHTMVFSVVGCVVVMAALLTASVTLSLAEPDAAAAADGPLVRHRSVWLLGVMVAFGLIAEGTALDWAAVHVRSLGASVTTAACAYFLYGSGMATGRLLSDRLTQRHGPVVLLRTGALMAAAGLGAGLSVTGTGVAPAAALIGWALLGLGLSPVVPLLYSAAGSCGPRAVAAVSTIGNVGLLAGPAAIGGIATVASLPLALTVPVALAATLALGAKVVAPART
ncbi:MFS transporter [Streptomyces sp. NPDC050485]|uniref:MFS transporter n=1 Tax=Streptomyces sp. NPDC050485 TaxID=3365617 RepID=UPI00378FB9B4